jgi:hypothetical protein
LTARHQTTPTSPRCQSAWQPNLGRGSTYRRGKSVQTTGTTSAGYSDITAERKVIGGEDDVEIFPASITEIEENFGSAIRSIEKKIADKHEEIRKLEGALEAGRELASGEMQRKLSEPEFKEMTQREFLVEKQQAELQAVA